MRLQEFADAEERINLQKMNFYNSFKFHLPRITFDNLYLPTHIIHTLHISPRITTLFCII